MSSLGQNLRYAVRTLRGSPGFSAVAILTLALGIGANTAIFSFVDGVLLKPLPYPEPDRIVRVLEKPPQGERNGISTLNFLDWQKDNSVFEYMSAMTGTLVTLGGIAEPVQLRLGRVSAPYFDIYGIKAALGRTFLPGEDQLGKNKVVVLTNALWVTQFGARKDIVGKTILLDNEAHTVVGVLPAGGAFDRAATQIWRPLAFEPSNMTRNFHWMSSFARLKPGVSLQQAKTNMDAIGKRIEHDFPDSNKGWGVVVERYADESGLVWPPELAPFAVHLVRLGADEAVMKAADELYAELEKAGVDVLYDDRDESAGAKFADADLMGMPVRLTVSRKTVEKDSAEWKERSGGEPELILLSKVTAKIKQ